MTRLQRTWNALNLIGVYRMSQQDQHSAQNAVGAQNTPTQTNIPRNASGNNEDRQFGVTSGMAYCNTCGKTMARSAASCPSCGAPNLLAKPKVSEKGMVPAALLAFFFGALGFHRFYVGKIGTGILMILTLGGLGIWALIDFVMIIVGSFKDKQGLPLNR